MWNMKKKTWFVITLSFYRSIRPLCVAYFLYMVFSLLSAHGIIALIRVLEWLLDGWAAALILDCKGRDWC